MGGSKKSAKPPPKKESRYKIPTVFNCPKCGGKGTVSIQIKRDLNEGYVYCNGECARMHASSSSYDDDLSMMDARPGQKRARERPTNFSCSILRLEEPIDVFFKYYEDYRARREAENGLQGERGAGDLIDEDNWSALREVGQPLSAAGRRLAANRDEIDDEEEDEGLLIERDEVEPTEGYEFGELMN